MGKDSSINAVGTIEFPFKKRRKAYSYLAKYTNINLK